MALAINMAWGFDVEVDDVYEYVASRNSYKSLPYGYSDETADVESSLSYDLETNKLELRIRIKEYDWTVKEKSPAEITFYSINGKKYTVDTNYLLDQGGLELLFNPFAVLGAVLGDRGDGVFTFDLSSMKCNGRAMSFDEIIKLLTTNNISSIKYDENELLHFMPTPTAEKLKPQLQEMYTQGKKVFGAKLPPLIPGIASQRNSGSTTTPSKTTPKKLSTPNPAASMSAAISKASVQKGLVVNGEPSLKVDVSSVIRNAKGKKFRLTLFFFTDEKGNIVNDGDTADKMGNKYFVSRYVTVPNDNYTFDWWWKVYLKRLDIPRGASQIKAYISLEDENGRTYSWIEELKINLNSNTPDTVTR